MTSPLDIATLCARIETGEAFTYLHFYGHTPRKDGRVSNAVFSQFYQCHLEIDGQAYLWAEQWMMAGKARLFSDSTRLRNILAAQSAQECKQLGREVANYDDARWSEVRFDLVTRGNVAKFGQNPRLKDFLLATGEGILVEAAPRDKVWGNGLDRNDANAANPQLWPGLNLLGFALIRTRSVLRGELPEL